MNAKTYSTKYVIDVFKISDQEAFVLRNYILINVKFC